MKTYQIINYNTDKTMFGGFKTEKEAKDFLWEYRIKLGKEKPEINIQMIVVKE